MPWDHIKRVRVAVFAAVMLLGPLMPIARAQLESAPHASSLPLTRASEMAWLLEGVVAEVLLSEAMVLLACALAWGLLVFGIEAFDLWCERRKEWGARLHMQFATALQHDRLLRHLPVTPVVHLPLWVGWRATIELRGQVPTLWLRHAVLRVAEREAAASAAVSHILDRIAIVPSARAWAV
jgi:hypothetical protein